MRRLNRRTPVQRLCSLFATIADEWRAAGTPRADYVAPYETPRQIATILLTYEDALRPLGNLHETEGCDLGCWLGFSTVILAALGPRLVHGVDIEPSFIEIAETYRSAHGLDGLAFRAMDDGVVPLGDGSVDWVVINQVLCNAVPGTFHGTLREAHRILRPGAMLMLCDGNNPHCPSVMTRLRATWRGAELGEGTPDRPDGRNHRARVRIIERSFPELDVDRVARLARETCYMSRDRIVEAGRAAIERGEWPGSVFHDDAERPTISPGRGAANGAVTEPFALARELSEIGFTSLDITCSPRRRNLDEATLRRQLETNEGFFIFAHKA